MWDLERSLKCWKPVISALVENTSQKLLLLKSTMKEEVLKLISNNNTASAEENYASFTTDAWSSSVNDTSLLSLTAHWIDSQFKKTSAVLNAQCLMEAHIGEYIAAQILSMVGKWDIALERVHLRSCN